MYLARAMQTSIVAANFLVNMKKILFLTSILLVFSACTTAPIEESAPVLVNIEDKGLPVFTGIMADVTGGTAKGFGVIDGISGEELTMVVDMDGLPELEEGFFYEGWLVHTDPFTVVSTGVAVHGDEVGEFSNTAFVNVMNNDIKYILTLEPDDGDPAPADHVLEGPFIPVTN